MTEDPKIQYLQVKNINLAYRESGDPQKPPMVLLHGLALTSAYVWRPLIEHFKNQYHIIAFDLLGHGFSDKPSTGYDATNQNFLLATALDALKIKNAVLLGHSLGGVVATYFAINNPDRVSKLILYDVPLPTTLMRNMQSFSHNFPIDVLLLYGGLILPGGGYIANLLPRRQMTINMMKRLRVVYNPNDVTSELVDQGVQNSTIALAEWVRNMILRPNVYIELNRLTMPTLLIVGDTDLFVPISKERQIATLIPDVQLTILTKAGHYALLDRPAEFNATLDHFLSVQKFTA